jgi:5-methylcytosine-specific restriction endonuclease McrA
MRHTNQTKLKVQVAVACGVPITQASKSFGVTVKTILAWLNANSHQKQKERDAKWRKSNPEKAAASTRKYREKNAELVKQKGREAKRKWWAENREIARLRGKRKYAKNQEYHKEKARANYRQKPGYYSENTRRRRAKVSAFSMTEIERMMCNNYYKLARELTESTGIPHEVDHIWPISKGGPHLPWNLRVITREENRSKRDKI